jgi:hypothetical protein
LTQKIDSSPLVSRDGILGSLKTCTWVYIATAFVIAPNGNNSSLDLKTLHDVIYETIYVLIEFI